MIFRIDDVCANTDWTALRDVIAPLRRHGDVWLAVSPLCSSEAEGQRVFPKLWTALSDHRTFYRSNKVIDLSQIPECAAVCSHGMVHVDHRLLSREAQELSIVTSCSLLDSVVFVPPFNKWNKDTESVCNEHGIKLVRFEDGWKSIEHNQYLPGHDKWYLHHRAVDGHAIRRWIG